jgi:transposase-like protein
MKRYTFNEFNRQFPDDAACLEWLFYRFYPEGTVECKNCGRATKHHRVASRPSYSCDYCGHHVHPTAGTIFHKSPTSLRLWFYVIYLVSSTRAGISAKQLERELGVTYKTAWRMMKQIRSMMDDSGVMFDKPSEMDETYMHPNPQRDHRLPGGKHYDRSQIVVGIAEKGGRVVAKHVNDAGTKTLIDQVKANVQPGTPINTDGWKPYRKLPRYGYPHAWIDHETGEYLVNGIGTQQIENFWSNFKRGIYGVYRHCGPAYLQSYVNEYAWRYSRRNSEMPMFELLLDEVA